MVKQGNPNPTIHSGQDATTAEAVVASPFLVVALGASAGGMETLRELFSRIPETTAAAFVVIAHLSPEQPSLLTKILGESTRLVVVEATDGMVLQANRVHVIPSTADLVVKDDILELIPRAKTSGLHLPIDAFFESLAMDAKARAVGVILSGSGSDGTLGLQAIKAEGGIAMAQSPRSAHFPSMPEAALAAEVVDYCGSAEDLANEIVRLSQDPHAARVLSSPPRELGQAQNAAITMILAAVRQHTGVDFSGYKRSTVLRRIERRMLLRQKRDLADYPATVEQDPEEARALARDILIHVTSFFRDPAAFDALKQRVLEPLAKQRSEDECIRIWVPGCATGEEAFALVICLLEALDGRSSQPSIKLFGTDLSDAAIEAARTGVYPEAAVVGVSPERRARFFEATDAGYRVSPSVRDLCVFVKHDLTCDPPFAKLDLISCRNVLIYFDAELQRQVVPMLHYCLNRSGYLFLGQSETITGFRDLFESEDSEHRIFCKLGDSRGLLHALRAGRDPDVKLVEPRPVDRRQTARDAQRQADHILLTRYTPPGVIVNGALEIVQFRGRTGEYLEPPLANRSRTCCEWRAEAWLPICTSSSTKPRHRRPARAARAFPSTWGPRRGP